MIAVQITYKVKPAFVEENKNNIRTFLADFKEMHTSNFLYNVYLKEDGVTFVHIAMYENKDIQNELLQLPTFKAFQVQRDEKGLDGESLIEYFDHVGSSLRIIQ